MSRHKKFLIPAAVGASLLLAACGGSSKSSSSSSSAAGSTPYSRSAPATASGVTITTAKGSMGTYLVGSSGRAVYLWAADTGGKSSCSGACAQTWTPVTVSSTPKVAGGVTAGHLTLVTRSDGSKQVAYNGHPLYYYAPDSGAGMTRGQGSNSFGAKWWLVAPSGSAITAGASATTSSRIPYFFSDQYEVGMEYSGFATDWDEVAFRGERDRGEFVAFWLKDGAVVAGMNVNVWDVNEHVQALIRSRQEVDVRMLTDPDTPLETLTASGVEQQ